MRKRCTETWWFPLHKWEYLGHTDEFVMTDVVFQCIWCGKTYTQQMLGDDFQSSPRFKGKSPEEIAKESQKKSHEHSSHE